jgi:hypothetical protein
MNAPQFKKIVMDTDLLQLKHFGPNISQLLLDSGTRCHVAAFLLRQRCGAISGHMSASGLPAAATTTVSGVVEPYPGEDQQYIDSCIVCDVSLDRKPNFDVSSGAMDVSTCLRKGGSSATSEMKNLPFLLQHRTVAAVDFQTADFPSATHCASLQRQGNTLKMLLLTSFDQDNVFGCKIAAERLDNSSDAVVRI